MKKRTKILIALIGVLGGTLALGACASADPYELLGEQGYDVRVVYDKNGGAFANLESVDLVDVYSTASVEKGVKLVRPGDAVRGQLQATRTAVSKSGCFLIGWYRECTARTDEEGNALDEDGNLCSATGKAQAYLYSGYWDFDSSRLSLEDDGIKSVEDGKGGTHYEFTLHAAWASNFEYHFYAEENSAWKEYGVTSLNPQIASEIALPAWNTSTGRMDYGTNFAARENETFLAAYSDPEKTQPLTGTVVHPGKVDLENGTVENRSVAVYTTWEKGTWFRITTAQQLISNAQANGCYRIEADLDFDELFWNFSAMEFSGTIEGNNHTLSNIAAQQSTERVYGGIFGKVLKEATIKDVTFKDVVLTIASATRQADGLYGLLAGELSAEATLQKVSLSGTVEIGDLIREHNYENFRIGLVSGNLVSAGIEYKVNVKVLEVQIGQDDWGNPINGFPVTAKAEENGAVTVAVNPDPSADPNPSAGE